MNFKDELFTDFIRAPLPSSADEFLEFQDSSDCLYIAPPLQRSLAFQSNSFGTGNLDLLRGSACLFER